MKKHRNHIETKQELLKLNYNRTKCLQLLKTKQLMEWNKKPTRFARNKTIVYFKITPKEITNHAPKKEM
jgi:hypothetical protein